MAFWIWVKNFKVDPNRLKMTPLKFRVVICRIRGFPTLISKIKWFGSGLPLIVQICISSADDLLWSQVQLYTKHVPVFAYPNIYGFYPNKIVWVPNLNTFFIDAFLWCRELCFCLYKLYFYNAKLPRLLNNLVKSFKVMGFKKVY